MADLKTMTPAELLNRLEVINNGLFFISMADRRRPEEVDEENRLRGERTAILDEIKRREREGHGH